MSFIDFLLEKRSNAEKNSKIEPEAQLKDYAKDADKLYASYTMIDKIGVNPKSDHKGTPIGIYTYPLDYVLRKGIHDVPYQSEAPYIWLLKPTKPVLRLAYYDATNLQDDIEKLSKYFPDVHDVNNKLPKSAKNNPADNIWQLTKKLTQGNMVKWNAVLRKILGYQIIRDDGEEIIHFYEPTQCVFLDRSCFEVVARINKKSNDRYISDFMRKNGQDKQKQNLEAVKFVRKSIDTFLQTPNTKNFMILIRDLDEAANTIPKWDLRIAIGLKQYNKLEQFIKSYGASEYRQFMAVQPA